MIIINEYRYNFTIKKQLQSVKHPDLSETSPMNTPLSSSHVSHPDSFHMHLGCGISSNGSKLNSADPHQIEPSDSTAEFDLSFLLPEVAHTCNSHSTFGNLGNSSMNSDCACGFKDFDLKAVNKKKMDE